MVGRNFGGALGGVVALSLSCTGIVYGPEGSRADRGGSSGAGASAGHAGSVGSTGSVGNAGAGSGGSGPAVKLTPEEEVTTPDGVSRLTRRQYNNSVSDLIATPRQVGDEFAFPIDDALGGYEVGRTATSASYSEKIILAAEAIASEVLADRAKLGCDVASVGEDACAERFIRSFTERAYRRAVDEEQAQRLATLYSTTKASYGFDDAIRVLIEAILGSPYFLYHLDPAVDEDPTLPAGSLRPVTGYGMASRLSFYLWGSVPDDALLAAAAGGELSSAAAVKAQAERMLGDPRARRGFHDFSKQWLQLNKLDRLEKSPTEFPGFDATTRDQLRGSMLAFLDEALTNGTLQGLMSADFAYVDEGMASLLGIPGITGRSLTRVQLDPARYRGLLTQPTLMAMFGTADESHPIKRGTFVMDRILCTPALPPTENLPPFPELERGLTNRQRVDRLTGVAPCIACHRIINPLGFSFEHYDGVGAYREQDAQGLSVDSSSTIVGLQDEALNGPVASALDLVRRLEVSDQVRACMVTQFYRAAFKRKEQGVEQATLERLIDAFEASGGSFANALIGVTQTNAFSYRRRPGAQP